MKLLSKIFNKKSSSGGSSSSSPCSNSSGDDNYYNRRNGRPQHLSHSCTATATKVLRILGAENRDEEIQIIRTIEEMNQEDPVDSTDISFEEDAFEDNSASSFMQEHNRLSDSSTPPPRCSSDAETFDPSSYESRSMSPTPSSRLSPANDPWCRSPQHSPRTYNHVARTIRDTSARAHRLPIPLRERVGNNLTLSTPLPLPLDNLSAVVASKLEVSPMQTRSFESRVSPLPSPPGGASPLRFAPSPRRSPPHAHQPPPMLHQSSQKTPKKLHEIGRGSYATVYEGFMEDGSFCAVKVVHDNMNVVEDTKKEIALLSQLNHQNIVRYLGVSIDDNGSLCIILELMKYSLKSVFNKLGTGFEESTIRSYVRQILHGLAYLHDQRTIHRDIKCANILVDAQGQVKLADFGVAKETPEASSLKGTPVFMAPEVLVTPNPSKRLYGTAVDIWSLGCTVVEMANGQAPWSDLGFAIYFKLSRGEAPPIPDTLSPVAKDFVRKCLRFNPDERPTARELLHHQFVIDAPSPAPTTFPSPLASPRASPIHRHSATRNLMKQETHFYPVEGMKRNVNLVNLMTREDPSISSLINRTNLEPQQLILRARHNEPELQGALW